MKLIWCVPLLVATLSGCMGTEPDPPKPTLEALSAAGAAFGQTLTRNEKQLLFRLRNSDGGFVSVAPLRNIVIGSSGAGVRKTHDCPDTLEEGAQCFISVYYLPTAAGTLSGTLTVDSNAEQGQLSRALSGTAVDTLSPAKGVAVFTGSTAADFSAAVGGSDKKSYTITNIGNATDTLTITGPTATDTQWVFTNNCAATLAPNASCTVDVEFKPTTTGDSAPAPVVVSDAYIQDFVKPSIQPRGVGR